MAKVITELYSVAEIGLGVFNVKENMSPHQVDIFVEDFLDVYPNESIADLKVCLKNARLGKYGTHYQSIDQLTVMNWFKKFLIEKSQIRQDQYQQSRKEPPNVLPLLKPDHLEEIKDNLFKHRVKENDPAHTKETVESHYNVIREHASDMDIKQLVNVLEGCKSHNKNGIYDEMIEFVKEEIEKR